MEVKPYEGFWYPTMGGLPKLWAVYDIVDRNGYALSEKSIEDYYYTSNGTTVSGKAKNYLTAEQVADLKNEFLALSQGGEEGRAALAKIAAAAANNTQPFTDLRIELNEAKALAEEMSNQYG